jgi:hypothetical protein
MASEPRMGAALVSDMALRGKVGASTPHHAPSPCTHAERKRRQPALPMEMPAIWRYVSDVVRRGSL